MPKLERFRIESARRLRAAMTDEERILWSHLWRIPTEGTHFRRQVSVGRFVVDFLSHRLKLIVEVDGAQHGFDRNLRRDEARSRWLESQGYSVLRFWNHEITKELNAVLDTIYAAVEEQRAYLPLDGGGRLSRNPKDAGQAGGGEAGDSIHPTPAQARRPSPSRGG